MKRYDSTCSEVFYVIRRWVKNILIYLLMFIVTIFVFVWVAIYGLPELVAILFLFPVYFILFQLTVQVNYTYLNFLRNLERIETYLFKRKEEPNIAFILASLDEDVLEMEKLLPKTHLFARKSNQVGILILKGHLKEAKELAGCLWISPFKHYHLAYIAILEKDLDGARHHLKKLSGIYRSIIEVEIAFSFTNNEIADLLADNLLKKTTGLYRYILYKGMENQISKTIRLTYF